MCWVKPTVVDSFINVMRNISTDSKDYPGSWGLGQVIKDFSVRDWWDIDFCSKKAYHVGDKRSYEGYYLLRDASKLVF